MAIITIMNSGQLFDPQLNSTRRMDPERAILIDAFTNNKHLTPAQTAHILEISFHYSNPSHSKMQFSYFLTAIRQAKGLSEAIRVLETKLNFRKLSGVNLKYAKVLLKKLARFIRENTEDEIERLSQQIKNLKRLERL